MPELGQPTRTPTPTAEGAGVNRLRKEARAAVAEFFATTLFVYFGAGSVSAAAASRRERVDRLRARLWAPRGRRAVPPIAHLQVASMAEDAEIATCGATVHERVSVSGGFSSSLEAFGQLGIRLPPGPVVWSIH
eukprot:5771323-Prymnesium_polylepis.2